MKHTIIVNGPDLGRIEWELPEPLKQILFPEQDLVGGIDHEKGVVLATADIRQAVEETLKTQIAFLCLMTQFTQKPWRSQHAIICLDGVKENMEGLMHDMAAAVGPDEGE